MLNSREAYKKIRKRRPFSRVHSCLEFDNFFAFSIAPFYISDKEQYLTGPFFTAVDKRTGKIYPYNILDNPEAYEKAKSIKIDTIFDEKV